MKRRVPDTVRKREMRVGWGAEAGGRRRVVVSDLCGVVLRGIAVTCLVQLEVVLSFLLY